MTLLPKSTTSSCRYYEDSPDQKWGEGEFLFSVNLCLLWAGWLYVNL